MAVTISVEELQAALRLNESAEETRDTWALKSFSGSIPAWAGEPDAERLSQDPAMRVVVGWQGSDRNAARTNTMSRFETETLTQEDNLKGLALMNPQSGGAGHGSHSTPASDSGHGQLGESSAWPSGGCRLQWALRVCLLSSPLSIQLNQFGDCEGATLRPGNVHSAEGWQELLEPVRPRTSQCSATSPSQEAPGGL